MRWHLCDEQRGIVRSCDAPDKATASQILKPVDGRTYVVSAASYNVPLPRCVKERALHYCEYCHAVIAGPYMLSGGKHYHRACHEKRYRESAEGREAERRKKENYRAKQKAQREEAQARRLSAEIRRNRTITVGIERRRIKRTAGLKPKTIVAN